MEVREAMTWTGALNDFNVVIYSWWAWTLARGGLRLRSERRALRDMERDRWARLAPGPSAAADLGTRIARAYLRGVPVMEREECDAVTAYIVADVAARWPPSPDDLRHIADATGEPESLAYLRSLVPGLASEEAPAITDDLAQGVAIRLLFTFCPPGQDRGTYLARASVSSETAGKLPADLVLPAFLLRRGTNDRAAAEAAVEAAS